MFPIGCIRVFITPSCSSEVIRLSCWVAPMNVGVAVGAGELNDLVARAPARRPGYQHRAARHRPGCWFSAAAVSGGMALARPARPAQRRWAPRRLARTAAGSESVQSSRCVRGRCSFSISGRRCLHPRWPRARGEHAADHVDHRKQHGRVIVGVGTAISSSRGAERIAGV
jgi:hypothetical protein